MNIPTWQCDCKHKANGMRLMKCDKCGKDQVICGVLDKPARKVKPKHHAPIDYATVRDPHIGTEEQIAVSTMPKGEK